MTEPMTQKHLDFLAEHGKGVLVTLRRNGRPQLSNVLYHCDKEAAAVTISVTAPRAKTKNAAREPWVALHVTSPDFWHYVVAEGRVHLSAVAADPQDEVVESLIDYYRAIVGEHPNWDEYRAAQVSEQRVLLTITLERTYGAG